MTPVNLIPAKYRDARRCRARARAWFTISGAYAIVLVVGYLGAATALGDGGTTASDLARTKQQVEELNRTGGMLKLQFRDVQIKLGVARTVGDQPDWSMLLGVLGKLADEQIILRSCVLETKTDSRAAPAAAKPATQPLATKLNLTLSGLGKSQSEVTQFVLRLEKLGLFDRVDLVHSAREPVGTGEATTFRIECALHGKGGSER